MRRHALGVVMGMAGTALVVVPSAYAPVYLEPIPGCKTNTSSTLIENRWVSVIKDDAEDDPVASPVLAYCYRPNGQSLEYAELGSDDRVYPRPALAVAGRTVAWAVEYRSDPSDVSDYRYTVIGLARYVTHGPKRRRGWGIPQPHYLKAAFRRRSKVGSVAVRPSGSVAWIACPFRPPAGSFEPTCRHAGTRDAVFRARAGTGKRELLARGRDIEPTSLRRVRDRVYWVQGRQRRSAPLP